MKISELLSKLISAELIPADPHKAWEAFTEAVLTLDLQGQANFNDASTELFDTHAALIWSEFDGEGSPNVDRPSTAIARSKSEPRRVGTTPAVVDDGDNDFLITPDMELAIINKAQLFAAKVCKVYRTHAINAARQGIADVNASILDSLGGE